MPLFETEGLVLKSYGLAEADKIVVFLTREQGIVRGVARGVKRLKSRFGSSLEPLSVVRLTYFSKDSSELVSVQAAELLESNFAVAGNTEFLQKFSYLIELLLTFVPPHDPNELLYRMVRSALDASVSEKGSLNAIQLYFELWLLKLSGFMPDWSRCDTCGRQFDVDEDAMLALSNVLQCATCSANRAASKISARELAIVASSRILAPAAFAKSTTGELELIDHILSKLRGIINQSAGREIRGEISLAVRR